MFQRIAGKVFRCRPIPESKLAQFREMQYFKQPINLDRVDALLQVCMAFLSIIINKVSSLSTCSSFVNQQNKHFCTTLFLSSKFSLSLSLSLTHTSSLSPSSRRDIRIINQSINRSIKDEVEGCRLVINTHTQKTLTGEID
jgi:hypothetical protein